MSAKIHEYIRPTAPPNGSSSSDTMPRSYQPRWATLRRILPHREDIQMSDGRQIKGGIVIHPIIATTILGVVVALGLSVRSEMNWQHDQLVKITTQKEDAEKAATQEHNDRALQASADQAWREKLNNQMSELRNDFKNIQAQAKGRQ